MSDFNKNADRLTRWCKTQALPFWAKAGRNERGGMFEFLNMDGSPVLGIVRVRVQARMAYAYAHAGALGWYDNARQISDHAWDYLIGPGCAGGDKIAGSGFKGCAHLLNSDASLRDATRDTYAQAFVILAGAWRYMAFGDKPSLDIAVNTLDFLDTHVRAENGGWLEGVPPRTPRRQNPHMHMFEALLALFNATNDAKYKQRLDELYALFLTVFYDENTGLITEFFDQNWTPAPQSGPYEPGHMMEWCWLLRQYERIGGTGVNKIANRLYEQAQKIGLNERTGLLFDHVSTQGLTPGSTHRTWPQTEFLKASIAQNDKAQASKLIEILFATYLNVEHKGGWIDQLNQRGDIVSNTMPASTFYHLISACAEVEQSL